MTNELWCLTTFFNPVGYRSRVDNYIIFANNLARQKVNLLTIELAFGSDAFYLKPTKNLIQMRSKSILWQKERMLNYAIPKLPTECKYIAWVDGDILFEDNSWTDQLVEKLQTTDIVQPFREVANLAPHETSVTGKHLEVEKSICWQYKNNDDWLQKRTNWKLPYATVGFAWAAKRNAFDHCGGMYDKHVLGSNDNLVIDCCLNSFGLHHYWRTINTKLKNDMQLWVNAFGVGKTVDYLPIRIYHLWHGPKKYRGYIGREGIINKHDYNPNTDIRLENNVYEWNSDKPGLHEDCRQYFYTRREDDDVIPPDPHIRL